VDRNAWLISRVGCHLRLGSEKDAAYATGVGLMICFYANHIAEGVDTSIQLCQITFHYCLIS
jgi:hypothetical protein